MAAAFPSQEQRPLKKAKLGPPDVYHQDSKQKEDELTPNNLKHGYTNTLSIPDEFGSARKNVTTFDEFGPEFMSILEKKTECNTMLDVSKKKQQINAKDNFFPVTGRSQNVMEVWFKDLAGGNKSLTQLAKRVPIFNKKDDLFSKLCEFGVPIIKAAWLIKMTAVNIAAMQENKTKKRQTTDQALEWTQAINQYLKNQMLKIYDNYIGNTASQHTSYGSSTSSMLQSVMDLPVKQWNYICRLAWFMYQEGLLDRHEYLASFMDFLEKMRQPACDIIIKLILSQVLQYVQQFSLNQQLSRRLAHHCAKKISQMCGDMSCSSPRTHSPIAVVTSPAGVTSTATEATPTMSSFTEYQNCPQHRGILMTLSAIIQTITIRCPTALIWHNLGEGKVSPNLSGSPLDLLPCAPSCLPMPPGPQNSQIRSVIRASEEQIKRRSRAVEMRWSSDNCQQSTTGETIEHILSVLEMLDTHNFSRSDSPSTLDGIYSRVFTAPSDKDNLSYDFNPVVNLLVDWAVCTDRTGYHRALVVAKILERRQAEIRNDKPTEEESADESSGSDVVSPSGAPPFQSLLLQFLDERGPVPEDHPTEQMKQAFINLMHLFCELIRLDIFSHDAYMCTLIARGDITMPVMTPLTDGVDFSMSSENQSIKHESEHPEEIKMDIDMDSMEQFDITHYVPLPNDQPKLSQTPPVTTNSVGVVAEPQMTIGGGSREVHATRYTPISRHVHYASHFPIQQDEVSFHEANQRMAVLYGVGRPRDEVRRMLKKITKELMRLFGKKNAIDVANNGQVKERKVNPDVTFNKFQKLSYHDQHTVTLTVASAVVEQLTNFVNDSSNYLPIIDNVSFLFDLMEHAICMHGLINFGLQILKLLSGVENQISHKCPPLVGIYTSSLCLCVVSLYRKYHSYVMLSPDMVTQAFDGLTAVVKQIMHQSESTSAERCIREYIRDMSEQCTYLNKDYADVGRIKSLAFVGTKPSASNLHWNPEFMIHIIHNPKLPIDSQLIQQLNDNEPCRYSFVCNAMLSICNPALTDKLNDISLLCAELTAKCSTLSSEWLGVLKALCYSSNHSSFIDILTQIDVSELSIHDSLAVFTAILISRHCFTLEELIHVALPSLMAACPTTGGCQDAEPGARLTCHLLLRLFKPSTMSNHIGQSYHHSNNVAIKSSCDRNLLSTAHDCTTYGAVLAVLKAMLVLGDSCEAEKDALSPNGKSSDINSLFCAGDDLDIMLGSKKNGMEMAGLSDYAKYALKEMCGQEWVRDKFLTDPHCLFNSDHLLDSMLTPKQAQQLLEMLCYPNGIPNQTEGSDPDIKQIIQRILQSLDRWSLRLSWLELQLMFKLTESVSESKQASLQDAVAKGTIELFQLRTAEKLYSSHRVSNTFSSKSETEKDGVWLIAPLISKLPSSIQGKILKIAGQVLESGNNFLSKSKSDIERNQNSKCLLSHQPFLSLILMSLKGQDEQKDGLLHSLHDQLETYITTIKELLHNSPDERQIRSDIHEALQLRLSLVGGMFDTIQKNSSLTTEWVLLLIQLVSNNVLNSNPDDALMLTILDMTCILVQGTHVKDNTEKTDDKKVFSNLTKKLKKEIGDKSGTNIDQLRQLIPIPKKSYDVIVCEPYGTVSTKGNKIGVDLGKKQGHQVSSIVKINPWEVIEGFKNPAPLSFHYFGAVKCERKPMQYEHDFKKLLYHTHCLLQPLSHYMEPPVPPADDIPPPPPPDNIMAQLLEKPNDDIEIQTQEVGGRKGRKNKRRQPRVEKARQMAFPQEPTMYTAGMTPGWGYRGSQPPPQQFYPPQQQPPTIMSNPRFPHQSHSKAMLSTMLRARHPTAGQVYQAPQTSNNPMYKHQFIRQRLALQPTMQNRLAAGGDGSQMYGSSVSANPGYGMPNMNYGGYSGSGNQTMIDAGQGGMVQHTGYQGGMMMPSGQPAYSQPQPAPEYPTNMPGMAMGQQNNMMGPNYGQQKAYMPMSQQRVIRHSQLMHMQQQQQMPSQPTNTMQSQQQQTAALVAHLDRQISSGQAGPPTHYSAFQQPPPQYQ